MPYKVKGKEQYSNYRFSSSDAHTVEEFNDLITKENLDQFEKERGCCIVYTHFASSFVKNGKLDQAFKNKMVHLSKRDGWFVPAHTILDHLLAKKKNKYPSRKYLAKLDLLWLRDRIMKKLNVGDKILIKLPLK